MENEGFSILIHQHSSKLDNLPERAASSAESRA